MLVPRHYEIEFIKELYVTSPVLCILLLGATAALLITLTVHGIQERRKNKNKSKKREAVPNRGTL